VAEIAQMGLASRGGQLKVGHKKNLR